MPAAVSTMSALCMDDTVQHPASKKHIETVSSTVERVPKKQNSGPALDAEHSLKALYMVDTIAKPASRQPTENANSVRVRWQL